MEQWKTDSLHPTWCPKCFFSLYRDILRCCEPRSKIQAPVPHGHPTAELGGCAHPRPPRPMGTARDAQELPSGSCSAALGALRSRLGTLAPLPRPGVPVPEGSAVGRPRPPRAGRGGRAGARGEGGQRRGEWPGRDGLINSPRRGGGGRSRRSRRCRSAPAAARAESGPRTAPPPRRPAPTMTAETHLQGVEISAAQFFEIWHHYDSDGDSFPSGARGARGASPREAGGQHGCPPGAGPVPARSPGALRGRAGRGALGAARREGEPGRRLPCRRWRTEREFGGSGDGSRNSFCCRQWVHGREGATKLHPGAAAGAEEGRLGRLMFRPAFPSSSGKKSFLEQTPVSRFLCSLLPSHGSCACRTGQREILG